MRAVGCCVLLCVVAVPAGCQKEHYATQLLQRDITFGKLSMAMTGEGDSLVASKRITAHRVYTMPDKAQIDVWFIAAASAPAKGSVLLLHGMGDSKASYLSAGQKLASMGYDVVLPDLRYHAASTGKYITYGAKERQDIKTVMDAMSSEKLVHEPFYALGVNLGGSAAILYAADDPRVRGVIAISPYKDFGSIATWLMNVDKLTYGIMLPAQMGEVVTAAEQMGQFTNEQTSTLAAAPKVNGPVIIAYTVVDPMAPMEHAQSIFAAAREPKKIVLITPVVEQMVLGLFWDNWIADRVSELSAMSKAQASSQPAASQPG